MTPIVHWMDRTAYRVLMGTVRESPPLVLDPPRYLRRSRSAVVGPGAVDDGDSPEPGAAPVGQAAG